jgi:hypothetical protein
MKPVEILLRNHGKSDSRYCENSDCGQGDFDALECVHTSTVPKPSHGTQSAPSRSSPDP